MNRRLEAIAGMVRDGKGLIDVGTDPGYLPASLAAAGYGGRLYAADINEGPLLAARRTAAEAGVSERIRFLLCDGLSLCPAEEIDTIVIAGMGGDLIVKILDEAEWCLDTRYHLILQPMTKAEVLRYWLIYNGFGIQEEILAEDAGRLYQILSARYGVETKLNHAELFLGKRSLSQNPALYARELKVLHERFSHALSAMEGRDGGARAELYREICRQLEELETTA